MKKVHVLWLVEHVARELDTACAVSSIASSRHGLEFEIAPLHSDISKLSEEVEPQIICIPYGFSKDNAKIPELLAYWPRKTFFNMSWEELYYNVFLNARAPKDEWSKKILVHHAWGDFFKDYLIEHGVLPEHIVVNGHPAYRFYDEPYRDLFEKKALLAARVGLDPDRRWIFFPENYGWAFKSEFSLKKLVENMGIPWSDLIQMKEYSTKSLRAVLQWSKTLAQTGRVEFILRPRPATAPDDFERFVRDEIGAPPSHFFISDEASVREWILASDVVLSSISTSLIEASLALKPAYRVEPSRIPDTLKALWHQEAPCLTRQEDFMEVCLNSKAAKPSNDLAGWARRALLGKGDPLENLADIFEKLTRDNSFNHDADINKPSKKNTFPQYGILARDFFDRQEVKHRIERFKALKAKEALVKG